MILDAHAHVWRRAATPQPWIDVATMGLIDADFWLADLARMHEGAGIDGSILVQTANDLGETRALLAAADGAHVRGAVGWVDLEGDVSAQVTGLRASPGGQRLVGIRHLAHQDPDVAWLGRDAVGRGLEALGELALPFDLVVLTTQLALAARVVAEHPSVRFVLDHLGKPPIAVGELDDWRRAVSDIAAFPNVVAKVSGLTMEAEWASWTIDDVRPVVEHALDVFGPERLLFATDWPLVELQGGPAGWLAVARDLIPDRFHDAVFSGNAAATYLTDASKEWKRNE